MDVISLVQSIENDYGMDCKLWPENDARLKKTREWYIKHSDEIRRNISYIDMQKIQKALDEQIPKKKICEIFGISRGKLAHDIELGKLSDTKWRTGGEVE
ncbi:hypothetical protein [Companilactobacillus nodensis]|uniref:hypothetical protein n=1 Tax=Companilactobacillus nodensis TaxID=460870 RepID=UPI0004681D4C|nr:hypothetical protein [Companilactobacillus nodensis]